MLASMSVSGLSLLYLAIPLGTLAALRAQAGPEVLLLLLVTVMASDTLQYYGGRAVGRRPLAPTISPKKTVEGAVSGLVAGIVVMGLVGRWWLPGVEVGLRLVLGAVVAGLGIAGDLFRVDAQARSKGQRRLVCHPRTRGRPRSSRWVSVCGAGLLRGCRADDIECQGETDRDSRFYWFDRVQRAVGRRSSPRSTDGRWPCGRSQL